MLFLCTAVTLSSQFSISDVADWAQVLIGIINLILIIYLFSYQRVKDNRDQRANLILQEQNINLQWFKELIIQPHLAKINKFYENLYELKSRIQHNHLTEEEKIDLILMVKDNQSSLRKSFVDLLNVVSPELYTEVIKNLDLLTDNITEVYIPFHVDPPFRFMLTHYSGHVDPPARRRIICFFGEMPSNDSGMLTHPWMQI